MTKKDNKANAKKINKKDLRGVKKSSVNKGTPKNKEKDSLEKKSLKVMVFMSNFTTGLLIFSILLLLSFGFFIVESQKRFSQINDNNKIDLAHFSALSDFKIVKKDKNFFGQLGVFSVNNIEKGLEQELSPKEGHDREILSFADLDSSPSIYQPFKYNYIYSGEDFDLYPEEVEVYKKINFRSAKDFSNFFSDKRIAPFDLKKFKNINLDDISFSEDRDYGYSIFISLKNGNFSLFKNWEKWPRVENFCFDGDGLDSECYNYYQLRSSDVPADQDIIAITDRFLLDYDITLSNYGPGELNKYWKQEAFIDSEEDYYIPEIVSVTYPLKINNQLVYEYYGQKAGLVVELDLREGRVSSLYNLSYQYYESSLYKAKQDKDAILTMINTGDFYNNYGFAEDFDNSFQELKEIDIYLGQAQYGLLSVWDWNYNGGQGANYYIPAYIFPVISSSEPFYFSQEAIIVPAIDDFFPKKDYFVPLTDSAESSLVR